jgi:1-deoxy-D-xylulose-5-phosphate reductoisomerase
MRVPIQYAITFPHRRTGDGAPLDLVGRGLTFEEADAAAFPALRLGYEAGRSGGSSPAVLNAADEIAVRAFLDGRIGFSAIPTVVARTLETVEWREPGTVEEVMAVDREAREVAAGLTGGRC